MEKILTFKWAVKEDKIVKFYEDEKTYDISDAVANLDFEKYGITKDTKVSVKFEKNEVIHISKVKDSDVKTEAPKVETNATSTTTSEAVYKIRTVKAYKEEYRGVLFEEESDWYSISKDLNWDNLGIQKGLQVQFTDSNPIGKSKSRQIISWQIVEQKKEEPKSEAKNDYDKKSYTSDTQRSIECQACLNSANASVSRLFAGQNITKEDFIQRVTYIARENYNILQALKNL